MIMSDIKDYFRLTLYWKHFPPLQAHLILEKTDSPLRYEIVISSSLLDRSDA